MLAQPQAAGRIAQHRIGEFSGQRALVAFGCRYNELYARLVVEIAAGQHQFERHAGSVGEHRSGLEEVIAPAALCAGCQRALQRRLRLAVEQVHDWLTHQRAGIGIAEQFEPGAVDLHDDAFLHLRDRVVGAMQDGLELSSIILRTAQCVGQRAFHSKSAQLAVDDGLHVLGVRDRYGVARAARHVCSGGAAVDLLADHDQRHTRCHPVAYRGDAGKLFRRRRKHDD